MVVQDLGVGLLVRRQDVHKGSGGVAGRSRRVDGSCAPQRRRQAEGSRRRAGVETLLVKRLQTTERVGKVGSSVNFSLSVLIISLVRRRKKNAFTCVFV